MQSFPWRQVPAEPFQPENNAGFVRAATATVLRPRRRRKLGRARLPRGALWGSVGQGEHRASAAQDGT